MKIMMQTAGGIALLTLLAASTLSARVIVVDQAGRGDAVTIQTGIEMAVDGDTVRVQPGYYDEGWWLDFLGKAVVLESTGGPAVTTITADLDAIRLGPGVGEGAVVRGFTVIAPYQYGGMGVYIRGTSPTIEQNIFKGSTGAGVFTTDPSHPLIRDNLILRNGSEGIYVWGSTPTIERNLIYQNGADGIYVTPGATIIRDNVIVENTHGWGVNASSGGTIEGNLVVGNKYGIENGDQVRRNVLIDNTYIGLENGSSLGFDPAEKRNNIIVGSSIGINMTVTHRVVLENNVLADCGTGLLVGTGGDPHVVRNNVFLDNDWGVYCDLGVNAIDLAYNDMWGSTSGDYFGCTPGEGSVALDPGFVDAARHHYALSNTSPLIDRGDPAILDSDSTRSDMGAYGGPSALALALTLMPRDTVLSRGGSLVYDLLLSNTTSVPQTVEGWADVVLPDRRPYGGNPILGPQGIHLEGYETLASAAAVAVAASSGRMGPITHPIPQNAPTGIYEYRAQVGIAPDNVLAGRSFYFLLLP